MLKCLLSPDAKQLATTSSDKTIKLWKVDGFKEERTLTGDLWIDVPEAGCCMIRPSSPTTSPSSSLVSLATYASNQQCQHCLVLPVGCCKAGRDMHVCHAGHGRWVWDCVFSVDAAYLVSASTDCTARLWDLASGETIRTYTGHNKGVTCCALNDSALGAGDPE